MASGPSSQFSALRWQPVSVAQLPQLASFIFSHGTNVWNWLPPEGIAAHMRAIAEGLAQGLVALEGDRWLGIVTFCPTHQFAAYQPPDRAEQAQAYICEAVVHREYAGRGLGTQLLLQAVAALRDQGLQDIYLERHEENAASAGMMRKAGFVERACFADPARRPHGSGRTTVCYRVA